MIEIIGQDYKYGNGVMQNYSVMSVNEDDIVTTADDATTPPTVTPKPDVSITPEGTITPDPYDDRNLHVKFNWPGNYGGPTGFLTQENLGSLYRYGGSGSSTVHDCEYVLPPIALEWVASNVKDTTYLSVTGGWKDTYKYAKIVATGRINNTTYNSSSPYVAYVTLKEDYGYSTDDPRELQGMTYSHSIAISREYYTAGYTYNYTIEVTPVSAPNNSGFTYDTYTRTHTKEMYVPNYGSISDKSSIGPHECYWHVTTNKNAVVNKDSIFSSANSILWHWTGHHDNLGSYQAGSFFYKPYTDGATIIVNNYSSEDYTIYMYAKYKYGSGSSDVIVSSHPIYTFKIGRDPRDFDSADMNGKPNGSLIHCTIAPNLAKPKQITADRYINADDVFIGEKGYFDKPKISVEFEPKYDTVKFNFKNLACTYQYTKKPSVALATSDSGAKNIFSKFTQTTSLSGTRAVYCDKYHFDGSITLTLKAQTTYNDSSGKLVQCIPVKIMHDDFYRSGNYGYDSQYRNYLSDYIGVHEAWPNTSNGNHGNGNAKVPSANPGNNPYVSEWVSTAVLDENDQQYIFYIYVQDEHIVDVTRDVNLTYKTLDNSIAKVIY